MIEVEKIPADKLRFIPSGIPTPAPPSGADVRSELGIDADAPVVGVVVGTREGDLVRTLPDVRPQ